MKICFLISQIRDNITLAKYDLLLFYITVVDIQVSAGGGGGG